MLCAVKVASATRCYCAPRKVGERMTTGSLDSHITARKNSLGVAGTSARVMRRVQSLTYNLLAIVVSLIMITPICLVLINSLKTRVQASSMGIDLPTALQWQNFGTVIAAGQAGNGFRQQRCCMLSLPP